MPGGSCRPGRLSLSRRKQPKGAAPAAKAEPSDRDSIREGLSPPCHTPISAPRSETRSRPQGQGPQGSCFLRLSSLGSALQSTR
jgi:hypothetical protein